MSPTLEGMDNLVDAVAANHLIVAVGCQLRFHPALELFKKHLDEESVGPVLAVRAEVGEYLPGWHPYEDYRQSYAARQSMGGGVIFTLIHEIDYLAWLFGVPRRVFAIGGHLSARRIWTWKTWRASCYRVRAASIHFRSTCTWTTFGGHRDAFVPS